MKKIIVTTYLFIFVLFFNQTIGQITTEPRLPTAGSSVTIYFDASGGGGGMAGYTGDVYAHTGVSIKDGATWQHVIGDWGENEVQPQLTRIDDDYYKLEITPSIREFYDLPANVEIDGMHFVFRGEEQESPPQTEDLFVQVVEPGLRIVLFSPRGMQPVYRIGDPVIIDAAATEAETISLEINNQHILTTAEQDLVYEYYADRPGDLHIEVTAYGAEGDTESAEVSVYVMQEEVTVQPLPEGVINGINYIDDNTVTLVLNDPPALKEFVFVIGDMNDWSVSEEYLMYRTPGGEHFWLTLEGLETGREYGFQYYIDGELRIADTYTHKVLDPWNDRWISEFNYPDLKEYPEGRTEGLVSIMHPGRQPYEWQTENFTPPAPEDMVIYELLIRDFVETSAIKTVMDSLDYLENLGVNVIQLMPVNQFGGNISWGYNPVMYFATDKAYGTREDYKEFIDAAHERGMAVVLDIVLNHSDDLAPYVQMYFDQSLSRPLPENPWYLETCPHEPWCWFQTFDQDSEYSKEFFRRVVQYWLTEFNIDGYRFDFTKGFTNEQTGGQGWNYDAARIENLKRIADEVWEVNPDAYVILEHFTANNEERELSDYGMLLWGNITYSYQEASMGWLDDSNFEWISYSERGWDDPHLVGYMESHDEERIVYKNITFGNSTNPQHNVRDLTTALKRAELAAAFYLPIPGPKMIWQFGELGYDYSINHCQDGTIANACRTDPKPVRWDYFDDWRRRRLYDVYSMLANLKQEHDVFRTTDYSLDLDGQMKRIHLNHPDNNVIIIGNFGVQPGEVSPGFQESGTWHEFFGRGQLEVTDVNQSVNLQPGEYRMYSSEEFPDHGIPLDTRQNIEAGDDGRIRVFPNPARNYVSVQSSHEIRGVSMIDLVGRTVLNAAGGADEVQLNVSGLHPGIYFIRIDSSTGVHTERIQVVR